MGVEEFRSYIANLPIGTAHPTFRGGASEVAAPSVAALDINNLPNGVVTGSNLIQFPANATPELKSSVTLSLLAAQRVAANDPVVTDPQQWIDRHNLVLSNLNWQVTSGGIVDSHFDSINVAVHQAIIPFLTAALGPAAAVGSLIITALSQLQQMDKSSPWITLFDSQSRKFNVSEYQFSVVEVQGNVVTLHLAAAIFDASYGTTQVLFFKVNKEKASFKAAKQTLSADSNLLEAMNDSLKLKLAAFTNTYIQSLPI